VCVITITLKIAYLIDPEVEFKVKMKF